MKSLQKFYRVYKTKMQYAIKTLLSVYIFNLQLQSINAKNAQQSN